MPTLPWTPASHRAPATPAPADADADAALNVSEVTIMASMFTLTSRRHTVRMLRAAMAVRRAALRAPGAVGVSLIARPLRREYYTLSSWADQQAIDAFVRDPVHREAMRSLAPAMASSEFTFWAAPAAPTPDWPSARQHLAAARRVAG